MSELPDGVVEVTSHYVRSRNALALRGVFTPLYMDYYLHLMQHGLRNDAVSDAMIKDALAAMALHMVSRPYDEISAWTLGFQQPLLNLFVTGNNRTGLVSGRVFTEDVKAADQSLFFSQVIRGNSPARQSVVPVSGTDLLAAAEQFYRQSQQLPARYFRLTDVEELTMLVAMPDCDLDWLESVTAQEVENLNTIEDINLLETRRVQFGCECTLEKIVQSIAVLGRLAREELFEADEFLNILCPRCGARYQATREDIQQSLAGGESPD